MAADAPGRQRDTGNRPALTPVPSASGEYFSERNTLATTPRTCLPSTRPGIRDAAQVEMSGIGQRIQLGGRGAYRRQYPVHAQLACHPTVAQPAAERCPVSQL